MDKTEILMVGLAGVALYMIWRNQKATSQASAGTTRAATGTANNFVDEIFGSNGLPYGNGWRYFENGVAIDPQGNYYQGGQLVWTAPK